MFLTFLNHDWSLVSKTACRILEHPVWGQVLFVVVEEEISQAVDKT